MSIETKKISYSSLNTSKEIVSEIISHLREIGDQSDYSLKTDKLKLLATLNFQFDNISTDGIVKLVKNGITTKTLSEFGVNFKKLNPSDIKHLVRKLGASSIKDLEEISEPFRNMPTKDLHNILLEHGSETIKYLSDCKGVNFQDLDGQLLLNKFGLKTIQILKDSGINFYMKNYDIINVIDKFMDKECNPYNIHHKAAVKIFMESNTMIYAIEKYNIPKCINQVHMEINAVKKAAEDKVAAIISENLKNTCYISSFTLEELKQADFNFTISKAKDAKTAKLLNTVKELINLKGYNSILESKLDKCLAEKDYMASSMKTVKNIAEVFIKLNFEQSLDSTPTCSYNNFLPFIKSENFALTVTDGSDNTLPICTLNNDSAGYAVVLYNDTLNMCVINDEM
ncbi:MAG: hypothetical protein ACI8ZF_000362 [Candidatus Midichloriaceae bacterium]|jgi:hypothetical protein